MLVVPPLALNTLPLDRLVTRLAQYGDPDRHNMPTNQKIIFAQTLFFVDYLLSYVIVKRIYPAVRLYSFAESLASLRSPADGI